MAVIEIRDILDESGKTVFPRTHVDAVIGLKDSNFFEAVTDAVTGTTSIKLKSQYSGLWADGFVSSGGIGTGGGGGGGAVAFLNDLTDVTVPTPTNGNLLSWDSSARNGQGAWVNVPRGDVGTPVSLVNGAGYSTLTVGSTNAQLYTKEQTDSLIGAIEQFHYEIYESTSAVLSPQTNVLYLIGPTGSGSDRYEEYVYANGSWTKIGDTSIDLSGYYTKTQVDTIVGGIPLVSVTGGSSYTTLTVGEDSVQFYTKSQIDGNLLTDITAAQQDGTMTFVFANGDSIVANLNHEHPQYVPITRTINGHALSQNVTLSAVTDLGVAEWAMGGTGTTVPFDRLPSMYVAGARVYNSRERVALITAGAISYNLSSDSNDQSRIVWEPNAGGTGIGAWHFLGNLYADGWVAAGGIGNGSGGGSGSLYDLPEVGVSSPQTGQFFYYDGTHWVNTPIKTVNNTSLIGSGNIEGGSLLSPATASSLGGVLVGSVISTPTINAISSTAGRYYYLQTDSAGHAFVNVPWEGGGGGGAETDPIFTDSAAYGITSTDITNWNAKAEKTGGSDYNFLVSKLRFSAGSLTVTQTSNISPARLNLTYTVQDSSSLPPTSTTVTRALAFQDEIPTALPNPNKLYFVSTNGTYYDGSAQRIITADSLGAPTKAGNETITGAWSFSNALTLSGSANTARRICFGDSSHYLELVNIAASGETENWVFHFSHGMYSDGFVAAGGIGSGNSGGGGGSSVSWGSESNNAVPLSVDGTSKTLLLSSAMVTSISSSSTNYQVPSAKCVYDTVGDIETLLAAL